MKVMCAGAHATIDLLFSDTFVNVSSGEDGIFCAIGTFFALSISLMCLFQIGPNKIRSKMMKLTELTYL